MRVPERLTWLVLVVSLVLATSTPLAWALMTPSRDAGTLPVAAGTDAPRPAVGDVDDRPRADRGSRAVSDAGSRSADVGDHRPGRGGGITGATAAPDGGAASGAGSGSAGASGDGDVSEGAPVRAAVRPGTRSARIGDIDRTPAARPARLRVPSLDITAPIVAVGVEDDGEMEVPEDVGDVGWYRFGPAPGEPGTAVIAGHVDAREQGRGAFFDLRRLDVGARIQVTDGAGGAQRFEVVARRTYDKANLPADELFSRTGPAQLVLITCGGDFDRDARSYRDNVVIYAQPLSVSR